MASKGHIRLRGAVWYVVIELPRDPLTPKKRNQKWLRTDARTEKQAEKARARIARDLARGEPLARAPRTVGDQIASWLEATTPNLAPSTVESYEGYLRRSILPHLGDISLAALTPLHIQNWLARLRKGGLAEASLATIFTILHAALEHATKLEIIPKNPARHVVRPRKRRQERAIWDDGEARRFLSLVRGDRFEALYLTALGTGLRRGELLALRWKDVDLRMGVLAVRAAQVELKSQGVIVTVPKTRHSLRRVTLPVSVVEALAAHKSEQDREREKLGRRWKGSGYIFTKPDGEMLPAWTLAWHWAKLRRRFVAAGLPYVAFHDLRHIHATLGLEAGVDPKTISQRLGHNSTAFTLDQYGHVTKKMQDGAANAIEHVLWPNEELTVALPSGVTDK